MEGQQYANQHHTHYVFTTLNDRKFKVTFLLIFILTSFW